MSLYVQAISKDGEQTDWFCDRVSYEGSGNVNLVRDGETIFTLGPEDYAVGFDVYLLATHEPNILN